MKLLDRAVIVAAALSFAAPAFAEVPAKQLFGAKRDAAALKPAVHGTYSKGCVAGAARLPDDGPTWQAMRLSRNRHWGHPAAVELTKRLSRDGRKVGWNGLLVGDLTQPRGGPMLTGHASHQAGLDVDIWLTPMPNRRLSAKERETLSATSMLKRIDGKLSNLQIDKSKFTDAHAGIIRTAAQYAEIERIFVHPTIKREMCERYPNRPAWLSKIRAQWKHHYHMHLRLGCPADSPGCKPQRAVPNDGCGKTLDWWFNVAYGPKPRTPPKQLAKAKMKAAKTTQKRRYRTLSQLPAACRAVLDAPGFDGLSYRGRTGTPQPQASPSLSKIGYVPKARPARSDDPIATLIGTPKAGPRRPSEPVGSPPGADPFAADAKASR